MSQEVKPTEKIEQASLYVNPEGSPNSQNKILKQWINDLHEQLEILEKEN